MPEYSIESDRQRFFRSIRESETPEEIVRGYLRYDGILYKDQLDFARNSLIQKSGWTDLAVFDELFDAEGQIAKSFLRAEFPRLFHLQFEEVDNVKLSWRTILTESRNEFQTGSVPSPPNQRLNRQSRAAFGISMLDQHDTYLYLFPHGYQLFQRCAGSSMAASRSRNYSRDITGYDEIHTDRCVVIIQDTCDGDNFAHFLFDWLPRIVYFLEQKIELPSQSLFVLGGSFGKFQQILIDQLIRRHGLDLDNFLIPHGRLILKTNQSYYIFSDQKLAPLHPAHMAHPRTIDIIRDTLSGIRSEISSARRLFISRADARFRKITNEPELIAILEPLGFEVVLLSQHDISTQISLFRGAEVVIGAHGMGLTHIAASYTNLSLLELFHPKIGSDAYIFISRSLGFDYHYIVGEDIENGLADYAIDVDKFRERVTEIFLKRQ